MCLHGRFESERNFDSCDCDGSGLNGGPSRKRQFFVTRFGHWSGESNHTLRGIAGQNTAIWHNKVLREGMFPPQFHPYILDLLPVCTNIAS
jgi:hypothetical protein